MAISKRLKITTLKHEKALKNISSKKLDLNKHEMPQLQNSPDLKVEK